MEKFKLEEIEDVIIIIKAKGKHYSIVANKAFGDDMAKRLRIASLEAILMGHDIVDKSLEDLKNNPELLKKQSRK